MPVAFPRTVLPRRASWPSFPTGLASVGNSGKVQRRTTQQIGRGWTESYGPLKASDATVRSWLARVADYWRNQTELTVDHRSMRTILGAGGGTPLVNGASQTGTSLVTDGWPVSTAILKAGDIIRVAGLHYVLDVTADVSSNASGQATLSIHPPIYSGSSPADNAAITTNSVAGSVLFVAYVASLDVPEADEDEFYDGLRITFRELPGVSI